MGGVYAFGLGIQCIYLFSIPNRTKTYNLAVKHAAGEPREWRALALALLVLAVALVDGILEPQVRAITNAQLLARLDLPQRSVCDCVLRDVACPAYIQARRAGCVIEQRTQTERKSLARALVLFCGLWCCRAYCRHGRCRSGPDVGVVVQLREAAVFLVLARLEEEDG